MIDVRVGLMAPCGSSDAYAGMVKIRAAGNRSIWLEIVVSANFQNFLRPGRIAKSETSISMAEITAINEQSQMPNAGRRL